jgi:hypothetical protein
MQNVTDTGCYRRICQWCTRILEGHGFHAVQYPAGGDNQPPISADRTYLLDINLVTVLLVEVRWERQVDMLFWVVYVTVKLKIGLVI